MIPPKQDSLGAILRSLPLDLISSCTGGSIANRAGSKYSRYGTTLCPLGVIHSHLGLRRQHEPVERVLCRSSLTCGSDISATSAEWNDGRTCGLVLDKGDTSAGLAASWCREELET
jgi:hypothetical protein